MAYALKRGDTWVEVAGGFKAMKLVNDVWDEVSLPSNWLELSTEEDRAELGLFEIEEPDHAPASVRVLGSVIEGDDRPQRVWQTEPIPLGDLRAQAVARIAARRWDRQQSMLWNGNTVPSDDTTLGRIMATVKLAELQGKEPGDVVAHWKFSPGALTPVTLAQAIGYGVAIGAHLQALFQREAELAAVVLAPGASADTIIAGAEAQWDTPVS
ncbi:DUF4376 domain-containing protein [Sphingomonadaceae bacterium G21617-S1]|nr:DUF4376 domain-containing protein [Sphingomonadaceae bacterium G21617-S1]